MADKKHDLFDFFMQANILIEDEYKRISRNVAEDPGTAGDQGELNWKSIIEKWIPSYFKVVTKGRLLNEEGETGPQMDIIILSPEYPQGLIDCKRYLSKGVVAVFECKNTLRREDIQKFFENSKKLSKVIGHENGSPRQELQSKVFYGLLVHSHDWKKDKSKPKRNITNAIDDYYNRIIEHPIEMPNMICVADLGIWRSFKTVMPAQVYFGNEELAAKKESLNNIIIGTGYTESTMESDWFTPVGSMIFQLLEHLAWSYPGIRDLQSYMLKLNIEGNGVGNIKIWEKNILSEEVKSNINKLSTGQFWDEWGMTIR